MTTDKKTGFFNMLRRFERDEVAATSIEYALIGVVMAVMLVAAVPPVRDELAGIFTYLTAALQTATG
jgi:Flp pilus assembly pilin Flp